MQNTVLIVMVTVGVIVGAIHVLVRKFKWKQRPDLVAFIEILLACAAIGVAFKGVIATIQLSAGAVSDDTKVFFGLGALTICWVSIAVVMRLFFNSYSSRKAQQEVREAEKRAFESSTSELEEIIQKLPDSVVACESQRGPDSSVAFQEQNHEKIPPSTSYVLKMDRLFDLYNKQVEKYQVDTQGRAEWSFSFAIVAMIAGLGFVFWGAAHIMLSTGWQHVAAGSAVSAIGGGISAYVTKTFLDVHRLSLSQLNHYFRQPVLNSRILTAQRLADSLSGAAREHCYEALITKIISLVEEEAFFGVGVDPNTLQSQPSKTKTRRSKKTTKNGAGLPKASIKARE